MKNPLSYKLLYILLFLLLSACVPITNAQGLPTYTPPNHPRPTYTPTVLRDAQVDKVEIKVSQAPIKVEVTVHGSLSESCAKLIEPQASFAANTFSIKVMSESPTDRGCVQIITPFEQTIQLDTKGLEPGDYTVVANGVSTTFTLPGETAEALTTIHLVVEAYDRSVKLVDANLPLDSSAKPYLGGFLPAGGSVDGIAYVIDPNNPDALAIGSNGPQAIEFIQSPAIYGLAVWPGNGSTPPRLAWGTEPSGLNQSSTIKISALDGTHFETLLTQDSPNPATQLVPEFWSADGQTLYYSKEPLGIGGYLLYGGGSSLYKLDIATKEVTEVIPLGPSDGPMACLDAISADLRYVADHCAQNGITVRDLQYGTSARIQLPPEAVGFRFLGDARFSPSGNHLAYALSQTDQGSEQGWVVLTQLNGGSKVILTSTLGTIYKLTGWLDNQTLLVQSINTKLCIPDCATELWALKIDGSAPTKLAEGKFLALILGDLGTVPPLGSAPSSSDCQDGAEYLSDDGLDGTTYAPNTAFTKTWTLKNIGTCTWDSSYLVYHRSGTIMTQQPGYWLVPQGQTVAPGQSVDISIGMTSPADNGDYWSYWGLKDGAGQVITIKGSADDASFYANIKVSGSSAITGKVTSTSINITPEQGSGDACTASSTYFVHANITTDGPAQVSYQIESSAGQILAGYFDLNGEKVPYVEGVLQFDKADTRTVNLRFVGPYPYPDNISVMLKVNDGEWITAKLDCP